MGVFWLISLVNSLYKIISKVLSSRLRMVMNLVVTCTQTTFIKGKQIMDSILITNECVDLRKRSRERCGLQVGYGKGL